MPSLSLIGKAFSLCSVCVLFFFVFFYFTFSQFRRIWGRRFLSVILRLYPVPLLYSISSLSNPPQLYLSTSSSGSPFFSYPLRPTFLPAYLCNSHLLTHECIMFSCARCSQSF
uniref:Uncharacterized protein n=1 Tax=Cacopsylla melanoneura TaxID=428564 RepID=A0A8D8LM60_9HEMI